MVYCSFNSASKFDPDTWGAWMRILGKVPASVLWLMRCGAFMSGPGWCGG